MIYYFSAEGNTAYAARTISGALKEKLINVVDSPSNLQTFEGDSLGFMFPVYSWGVPTIIRRFVAELPEDFILEIKRRDIPVWMAITCGDDAGLTTDIFEEILSLRGLSINGAWSIIMPNTYVLLPGFNVDSEELTSYKLDKCQVRLKEIIGCIQNHKWITDINKGAFAWVKSRVIYPLFIKYGCNPSKWRWNSECIKCGKCASRCPMDNIAMKSGHPRWGKNCIGCLACYHICPVHAVEYGNRTESKGQYICPIRQTNTLNE